MNQKAQSETNATAAVYVPRKSEYVLRVRRTAAGLGLCTDSPIARGKFIIEYYGIVLTREQADEKGGKYLFEINSKRVIDGSPRYNLARYLNHSCRPNCETDIVKGKIYIYAKRNIKPGEELTYDYGKEYVNDFIKPYGCKCAKCLG
ncbi:MAG: SET domain-containing protein [Candidatus Kaiserbacteria bacterium]|nr:SET domain-containing protein [Candidatus Kaiserbacteria bacterium]